jgi:nucleotide-binding universal stress UspA family protein
VPFPASIDQMADDLELREQTLPELVDWETACKRAAALFGLTIPTSRNASNVAKLVEDVQAKARETREVMGSLVRTLDEKSPLFPSGGDNHRLRTARSAQALLAGLLSAEGAAVVTTFALATVETSEVAMRQTLAKARELDEAVRTGAWDIFEAMKALTDARQMAAKAILAKVSETLAADEHAIGLKAALDDQRSKAVRLLTVAPPFPPTAASPPPPPYPQPSSAPAPSLPEAEPGQQSGKPAVVVQESAAADLASGQAKALLDDLHAKLDGDADLRLSISWRLEKPGTAK